MQPPGVITAKWSIKHFYAVCELRDLPQVTCCFIENHNKKVLLCLSFALSQHRQTFQEKAFRVNAPELEIVTLIPCLSSAPSCRLQSEMRGDTTYIFIDQKNSNLSASTDPLYKKRGGAMKQSHDVC